VTSRLRVGSGAMTSPTPSTSCVAPRVNIYRSPRRKMPRLTTIRRTTRRASRRTGRAWPVGKPETVLAKLEPLIESNKADELMVTAMIFDHVPCKHSYELLAKALA
jgi:alkanesulfonate monooxygenase SsuD/methylene tetrahydromethanopterin reductase-like flavin-dependent oxidoreductase (luciferase family)